MSRRLAVTAAFLAIAAFGNYSILGLAERNGWTSLFAEAIAQDKAAPTDVEHSNGDLTLGIAPLDFFLSQLVRFFQPCVTGERPALSVFAAYFAGQVVPLHTAVVLEGLRHGNKGTILKFSTIWAMVYQSVPVGIIMAIYCMTYIWISPLAKTDNSMGPATWRQRLSIEPAQLCVVPVSMTLGYILPTVLAALPSPTLISISRRKVFLALWQFFPLWVGIWQLILTKLGHVAGVLRDSGSKTSESKLSYSRHVYRYSLIFSSIFHFAPILYILFPELRPNFLQTLSSEPISIGDVFMPMSAFTPVPVHSIAEGGQILLQYDLYCALAAASLWVVYLSLADSGSKAVAGLRSVCRLLIRTVVVGPGGAVMWALWDRDQHTLDLVSKQD